MQTIALVLPFVACIVYGRRVQNSPSSAQGDEALGALASLITGSDVASAFKPLSLARSQASRSAHPEMYMGPGDKKSRAPSKRFVALSKQVERDTMHQPLEAVTLMKKYATANFVERAEFHANLNLQVKYGDQQIRTTVSLPHGSGKSVTVTVLAPPGPMADAALEAGADRVGMDEIIDEIAEGKLDFQVLLATPPAMPKLARFGRILGPKGLMPSPKAGTVVTDTGAAVREFKAGKLEFRTDKTGNIHVPFGNVNMGEKELTENLITLAAVVEKNRPSGTKGRLWKKSFVTSSMGPSMQLDMAVLLEAAKGVKLAD